MEQKDVIKAFESLSESDYPEKDEDLELYVKSAGLIGIAVVLENLEIGRYVRDSLYLCHRLEIQEAIPLIKPYLISEDNMVKIWAAIALSKMKNRDGLVTLKQMIGSGEFPKHWLSWLEENGITTDFTSTLY